MGYHRMSTCVLQRLYTFKHKYLFSRKSKKNYLYKLKEHRSKWYKWKDPTINFTKAFSKDAIIQVGEKDKIKLNELTKYWWINEIIATRKLAVSEAW